MKTLQFDSSEFSVSGAQAHAFSSQFAKSGSPSSQVKDEKKLHQNEGFFLTPFYSQVIIRVAQEVSSLATSLPLDFSSAIYVRSDDDKATLLRAIITG